MRTIACIGGTNIDYHGVLYERAIAATSNSGRVSVDVGGVARNVAWNLTRLGVPALLCSRVGNDEGGRRVMAETIDTSLVSVSETCPTASYTAILEPDGELVIGLDDMAICDEMTPEVLTPGLERLRECGIWFVDANIPGATIAWLVEEADGIPVAVDATTVAKSVKLLPVLGRVDYLFCNLDQARVLGERVYDGRGIVSAGASGITVFDGGKVTRMAALPAVPRDVTGCGDALISGTLFGLVQGAELREAARFGLAAAAITVESANSTAENLTIEALRARA